MRAMQENKTRIGDVLASSGFNDLGFHARPKTRQKPALARYAALA
jgi:hypothetical protein